MMLKGVLIAIGLVLTIGGLMYSLFPNLVRMMIVQIIKMDEDKLKLIGVGAVTRYRNNLASEALGRFITACG